MNDLEQAAIFRANFPSLGLTLSEALTFLILQNGPRSLAQIAETRFAAGYSGTETAAASAVSALIKKVRVARQSGYKLFNVLRLELTDSEQFWATRKPSTLNAANVKEGLG